MHNSNSIFASNSPFCFIDCNMPVEVFWWCFFFFDAVYHLSKNMKSRMCTQPKILTNKDYLDCKSAQNTPLFLPMLFSSEFTVKQFPCAVHSTVIYKRYWSRNRSVLEIYSNIAKNSEQGKSNAYQQLQCQ